MSDSRFSTKIELKGDSAEKVRSILENKMSEDNRKTYTSAIESIIIEYPKLLARIKKLEKIK